MKNETGVMSECESVPGIKLFKSLGDKPKG